MRHAFLRRSLRTFHLTYIADKSVLFLLKVQAVKSCVKTTMEENKFADVDFSTPTLKDKDDIKKWLCENFFPDEPVSRTFGFDNPQGFFGRQFQKANLYELVDNVICKPHSILAKNKNGEIVGMRLGYTKSRSDPKRTLGVLKVFNYLGWIMPKKAMKLYYLLEWFDEEIRYNPHKAMDDIGVDKLYNAVLLCVSKSFRGRGLGKELLNRSIDIAREEGCEAMYVVATGKYSQAIFEKAGFTCFIKRVYADVKGPNGSNLFDKENTREHERIKATYKKIAPK